ncbi:MAG: LysE family translocator [Desulfobacterales bacterium]|nr:LysE family translocator [Desulfobacterales bacterium]
MSLDMWIPFVLASALILVIPGPTIILVVSQAIAHGRWSVLPLVTGVLLGDLTAMTLSFLGLGALLSASSVLFGLFKWIGACYLVYLGVTLWRTNPEAPVMKAGADRKSAPALLKSAFIVTALNPKGIAFFAAFLPQFIDPAAPPVPQLTLLGGTFLGLATVNVIAYAAFAGELKGVFRKDRVKKWLNRCGGGALVGAGIVTAGLDRTS